MKIVLLYNSRKTNDLILNDILIWAGQFLKVSLKVLENAPVDKNVRD